MKRLYGEEVKDYGSYCYDILIDFINAKYATALRENKPIPQGYSGWSPNNVRRIIITPDGIIVQYYVSVGMGVKEFGIATFNRQKRNACFSSSNYKPMISALTSKRICSGLEEVILLTNGETTLPAVETRFVREMLKEGIEGENALSRRYLRMCCISVASDGFLSMQSYIGKLRERGSLLTEMLLSRGINVQTEYVNKDTWYKTKPNLQPLGVDGKGYIEDTKDGKLGKYFTELIAKYEQDEKEKKIKDFDEKRNSTLREKMSDSIQACKELISILEASYKMLIMLNDVNKNKGIRDSVIIYIPADSRDIEFNIIRLMNKAVVSTYAGYECVSKFCNSFDIQIPDSVRKMLKGCLRSNTTMDDKGVRVTLGLLATSLVDFAYKYYYICIGECTRELPKYTMLSINNYKGYKVFLSERMTKECDFSALGLSVECCNVMSSDKVINNLSVLYMIYNSLYVKEGTKWSKYTYESVKAKITDHR